jgi:hypothetical protein
MRFNKQFSCARATLRLALAMPNHRIGLNQFQGCSSAELMSSSGFFLEKKPPFALRYHTEGRSLP